MKIWLIMMMVFLLGALNVWGDGMWPNTTLVGTDPDYWDGVPVYAASGAQWSVDMVSGNTGTVFVAWADGRLSGDFDVYCQKVNSDGNGLWTAGGVLTAGAAKIQYVDAMMSDGLGGLYIVWQDSRDEYNVFDLYAQHIDENGNLIWSGGTDGRLICNEANSRSDTVMVSDGSGGMIIAWVDYRNGSTSDIYAQRVDEDGNTLWAENGVPVCTYAESQTELDMTAVSGGFMLVWRDRRVTQSDIYGTKIDIYGQIVSPWSASGTALCDNSALQHRPKIVSDGNGGAVVVWLDGRNGNYWQYGQRISNGDAYLWDSNGRLLCSGSGTQSFHEVFFDADHTSVMTAFKDGRNGSDDIYAQRINVDGSLPWGVGGVPVCRDLSTQAFPWLCSDGQGGAYYVWRDSRNGKSDVYGQRLTSAGNIVWQTDGMPVRDAANDVDYPHIASDNLGGGIAFWCEDRTGSYDVYAQRLLRQRPIIDTISPDPAPQELGVFQLIGTSFYDDYGEVNYVKLTRSGQSDIIAGNIILSDNEHLSCQFNLSTAAVGEWIITAYDSLGQTSTAQTLMVSAATATPTRTMTSSPTRTATATRTPGASVTRTPTATTTLNVTATVTRTRTPVLPMTATPSMTETQSLPDSQSVRVYPNPAREKVIFSFDLPSPQSIVIGLYNIKGERVSLIEEQVAQGRDRRVVWQCGQMVRGVYIARISVGKRLLRTEKIAIVH